MNQNIRNIINRLRLDPHPEGGYFRETYRSATNSVLGKPFDGARSHSTCIYFMLTSDSFSAFHRIHQDEIWHFYHGNTISLHTLSPDGEYQLIKIGNDLEKGEAPQYVVPGGHWFAAEVPVPGEFALVGCTVAPGFDFADFEMADGQELASTFPKYKETILRLSR